MHKRALAVVLAFGASQAIAGGAANFTLINGTDGALGALTIRRAGTQDWKPLGPAPAAGARGSISFSDPDCAFDIRANGANVTWAGVNLCDVKSVTLRRDAAVGAWVDYDQ